MSLSISINPGRIAPSQETTVSFIGVGTTWTDAAPTFTASGTPSDDESWALGAETVIDDTHATLVVTTGATIGTITWTDSTTSATTTMTVARMPLRLAWRRRNK